MELPTSGILEMGVRRWQRLTVYSDPLEFGGDLDVLRPINTDIETIRGGAELAESKLLALGSAGMDTIPDTILPYYVSASANGESTRRFS